MSTYDDLVAQKSNLPEPSRALITTHSLARSLVRSTCMRCHNSVCILLPPTTPKPLLNISERGVLVALTHLCIMDRARLRGIAEYRLREFRAQQPRMKRQSPVDISGGGNEKSFRAKSHKALVIVFQFQIARLVCFFLPLLCCAVTFACHH